MMMFDELNAAMAWCFALAESQTQEIFGDRHELRQDEFEIAFDGKLTHEERVEKLKTLRVSQPANPRSFTKRLTKAGRLHAQGLGIKLD
jgi:hypothetical protein